MRLSYAEDCVRQRAPQSTGATSTSTTSPTAEPGKGVSIVFAGNRYFSKWSAGLGDFYVRSGGSRGANIEDARVMHLTEVLKRVESVDVPG